ncbi:MAG: hypothetical protein U0R76_12650 [Candidatus Nanopelagicales bacterium]
MTQNAAPTEAAPRTAGGLGWPLADGVPSGGLGWPTTSGPTAAGEEDA